MPKDCRLIFTAIVVFPSLLTGCVGQPKVSEMRTITVVGEGKAQAPPDRFELRCAISARAEDLDTAWNQAAGASERILATIQEFNVDPEKTQTLDLTVDRTYHYDTGEETGFSVEQPLVVVLTDLSQVGALTRAVLEAGAREISSTSFRTSQEEALQEQVRDAALRDALAKARSRAGILGQTVGVPARIEDVSYRSYLPSSSSGQRGVFNNTGGRAINWIAPKYIEIRAKVEITFALESP